jgi:hypothetical protein
MPYYQAGLARNCRWCTDALINGAGLAPQKMENIMKVLRTSTLAAVSLTLSMGAVADPGKPRVFQASPVINAGSGAEVGAAWLKRSKNSVEGRIMTTVTTAGIPYTVWWVIFNNPAGCITDCGMADIMADGGAAADVAIFNASGAISAAGGVNGVINFDMSAIGREGASIGSQVPPPPATNAPPWNRVFKKNNARCAEIHLDINFHVDPPAPAPGEVGYWVRELTYPAPRPPPLGTEAFAAFKPPADCKKKSRK